jgi:hypothetical protein
MSKRMRTRNFLKLLICTPFAHLFADKKRIVIDDPNDFSEIKNAGLYTIQTIDKIEDHALLMEFTKDEFDKGLTFCISELEKTLAANPQYQTVGYLVDSRFFDNAA